MRRLPALLSLVGLGLVACGGGPRASQDLRVQLAEAEALRDRAPDLVASVESALDAADRAEGGGDAAAADDHVTRARLLLDAARAEAARIEDERARREVEAEIARVLARARRDEEARAGIGLELARAASAATAREEAARALAEAERDESRGARRRRVTLEEPADLRRGAAALRERAETVLAAARALGAAEAARADAEAALAASRASRDPAEALRLADRAHHEALRALGAARGGAERPGRDAPRALAEAAAAVGFEAASLPEGVALEARGLFAGRGASLTAASRLRVTRLARLAEAHPVGPIQVQAQVALAGAAGERLARQRAEALVRALVAEGVAEARLTARPLPPTLATDPPVSACRLVFLAYAP